MHNVTLPNHRPLKVGTLSTAMADVAKYLEFEKQELARQLFGS